MRTLFKHAHLIVDDYREYIDGALLKNDEYIEDVFVNSNKVDNISYDQEVDLHGKLLLPKFLDLSLLDNNQVVVDPLKGEINTNKAIMLGNSDAYLTDVSIDYDGYYNLFKNMTGFDAYNPGLVNKAFYDYDKYVEIDGGLDKNVLNVVYKLIRKDRIILIGDVLSGVRKLLECKANYNEILMMSSLNAYRLFKMDKQVGSLIKGKKALLMVCDDDFKEVENV